MEQTGNSTGAQAGSSDSTLQGSSNKSQDAQGNGQIDRSKETRTREGHNKGSQVQEQAHASQAKDSGADDDDEFEEVKIGSVSGKVPKQLAKAVKDLERGVQKKFQEFSHREKAIVSQLLEAVKSNPRAVLKHAGIDPEEFAEATLAEKIEMLQMTPEQKRLKELEDENKKYKEVEEKSKKQKEEEEQAKVVAEESKKLDQEIAEAWRESKLPQDLFYVKQIAAIMRDSDHLAKEGKLERPLTAKQAAGIVKQRFEKTIPQLLTQMDPEGILRLMGEENFNRLRKWDIERVTQKVPPTVNSHTRPGHEPASTRPAANRKKVFTTDAEWRKHIQSLA